MNHGFQGHTHLSAPRMAMMGESYNGQVPGSVPSNVPISIPSEKNTGQSEVLMSGNHASFSQKADPQQGAGAEAAVVEAAHSAFSEGNNAEVEEESQIKTEDEDDCEFIEAAHDIFLKVRNKEITIKAASETLGRPYKFTYNRYKEFCDIINGIVRPEKKRRKRRTKIDDEDDCEFMEAASVIFLEVRSKEITIKAASETLGRPYKFTYNKYKEFCDTITGIVRPEKKMKRPKELTKTKSSPTLSANIYQCEDCPATFYWKYQLTSHSKLHFEDKESHICTACGVVFPTARKLMNHRINFHKEALQCPHCDAQYTIITSYRYHILTHTGEKSFVCTECGKGFYTKNRLQSHYRLHTGEKPYMCGYCEQTFGTLNKLKRHLHIHTGERPKRFACEQCGKRYFEQSTLNAHLFLHTGEKPYSCNFCEKKFALKALKVSHEKVHTGEQPHQCDLCPAAFSQINDLTRHKISHTGIKLFNCTVCDYSCTRKRTLQLHSYEHTGETPFKCDFYGCNAEFSKPRKLKKHKLDQHEPAPPRTCKICHEQFKEAVALKRHMMIHTGEKPLTCDQCFKTCLDQTALKRHMYHKHMYKPAGVKHKQFRGSRKNPGAKKTGKAETVNKKWPTEFQESVTVDNGQSSQALTQANAVGLYTQNIQANETISQQPFHPITATQYTHMVNNPWPTTMDPDEFRRRLLHSFK